MEMNQTRLYTVVVAKQISAAITPKAGDFSEVGWSVDAGEAVVGVGPAYCSSRM